MKKPILLLVAVGISALLSGCGSEAKTAGPAPTEMAASVKTDAPSSPAAEKRPTGIGIKTGNTSYGRILQDGRGHTIYLFTKERSSRSRCYGACATAWPPVYTKGTPRAARGVKQSKLGTTRHGKRQQATYNGHPLYYYVGETEPNEVLCQAVYEYGGYWYVIDRLGDAITAKG